ncbi:MAG: SGNH/GDSL hydrolase family protein [Pseudomonadota bacterium]
MTNYYWNENQMKLDAVYPTILLIGDSWFWYPFVGGSLTNNLGDIVAKQNHILLAKGMNGAEVFDYVDYVDGKYAKIVREALRLYGSDLSAVFLSGGGNDFAGFNDMRPLLKDNCSAETTAANCFRSGDSGLQGFMDRMDEYYRKLIGMVYTRTSPNCLIVMHTYDYAIPNGKGVVGSKAWIEPALVDAQVPSDLHQACVRFLIDSFHGVLAEIVKMDPKHLFVVDSRGTLGFDEWANELHPTSDGFKKIADTKWRPVLKAIGLA